MARAKDLAGLAALGFLGYKLHQMGKGKDDAGKSADSSSYTRDTKKVEAKDEPFKATNASSYTGTTKNNASNIGFGGGTDSDKNLKLKSTSRSMPKAEAKAEAKVDAEDKTTTTSSRAVPGGDAKRTEGNKPMPSLKAVEARAASNKTDAMKNASRAQQAGINRQKAMRANPESQAAERVYPEELLVGGPGVKVVGAAAKNLANRGAKEIAEYSTPRLAAPAKQLTGPSKADLVARDRAAREAARQEQMLKENASRYGLDPKAPGYDAAASSLRRNIGGEDFTIMKRGGMTKMASGGMTASRRGDGIATKGKTRGKIC
jgi:hypothetical protein